MGFRRKARECALQMLFQIDVTGDSANRVQSGFWSSHPVPEPVSTYADQLVHGTIADRPRIDQLLQSVAHNWRLDRMALVDRNVLRLAVFELLHQPGTPHRVVINEAIEIAKRFSSDQASQFINGVLDGVWKELGAVAE